MIILMLKYMYKWCCVRSEKEVVEVEKNKTHMKRHRRPNERQKDVEMCYYDSDESYYSDELNPGGEKRDTGGSNYMSHSTVLEHTKHSTAKPAHSPTAAKATELSFYLDLFMSTPCGQCISLLGHLWNCYQYFCLCGCCCGKACCSYCASTSEQHDKSSEQHDKSSEGSVETYTTELERGRSLQAIYQDDSPGRMEWNNNNSYVYMYMVLCMYCVYDDMYIVICM